MNERGQVDSNYTFNWLLTLIMYKWPDFAALICFPAVMGGLEGVLSLLCSFFTYSASFKVSADLRPVKLWTLMNKSALNINVLYTCAEQAEAWWQVWELLQHWVNFTPSEGSSRVGVWANCLEVCVSVCVGLNLILVSYPTHFLKEI